MLQPSGKGPVSGASPSSEQVYKVGACRRQHPACNMQRQQPPPCVTQAAPERSPHKPPPPTPRPASPPHAQTTRPHQQERVCFNPHPKTLTMAGDYEYFAAQGHHPLAFALAELVDNALRATKGNK
jgi:hypothetical protein